jgi:hypothetical protein
MNIYKTKKGIIMAVAKQLPSSIYEGPSITNSAEFLWIKFCQEVDIPSTNMILVEKYEEDNRITTDIVLHIHNDLTWKRLDLDTFNRIVESSQEISMQEACDCHSKRIYKKIYREWAGSIKLQKFIDSYAKKE